MTGGPDRQRLAALDRIKGLAIVLVVYGHLLEYDAPAMQAWYAASKLIIYKFHMPLFLYVSGFVYQLTDSPSRFERAPLAFMRGRADRLLVPFMAMALLIVSAKAIVASSIKVNDQVDGFAEGLWAVASNAPENPVFAVWYLLVLFLYSIVTPWLWRLSGRKIALLAAIGLALYFLPQPKRFYIEKASDFYIYFVAGFAIAQSREWWLPLFRRCFPIALAALLLLCFMPNAADISPLIFSMAAIPAVHGLLLRNFARSDDLLLFFGGSSMAIYLMNTIFIGIAKAIWARTLPEEGAWFVAMVAALLAAGIAGPIALRWIIERMAPLKPLHPYLR